MAVKADAAIPRRWVACFMSSLAGGRWWGRVSDPPCKPGKTGAAVGDMLCLVFLVCRLHGKPGADLGEIRLVADAVQII